MNTRDLQKLTEKTLSSILELLHVCNSFSVREPALKC